MDDRYGAGGCDRVVRALPPFLLGCGMGMLFSLLMWSTDGERASCSDYSGSNTKLPKILLNGNNICMVRRRTIVDPLGRRINLKAAHTWR